MRLKRNAGLALFAATVCAWQHGRSLCTIVLPSRRSFTVLTRPQRADQCMLGWRPSRSIPCQVRLIRARSSVIAVSVFDPLQEEVRAKEVVVTTSKSPTPDVVAQAEEVCKTLGAPLEVRRKQSMKAVAAKASSGLVYLVRRVKRRDEAIEIRHEICDGDGNRLYANPRMWRLVKDPAQQPLIRAVAPADEDPPAWVIDATAGLGGTAMRIAHACGSACKVTAVEICAPLACQLHYGLHRMASQQEPWSDAASRVAVVNADAKDFLRGLAERRQAGCETADVVYLNPCMDVGRPSKEDLFLHRIANLMPISREAFEAAAACARRRVVLRSMRGASLPFGLSDASTVRVEGRQSDFLVVATH